MSSTKSLIECLQDEIKYYDEELTKEFAKQVKDPRKQDELLKKRHKCFVEKCNEWDRQDKEWKKCNEWDKQDKEQSKREEKNAMQRAYNQANREKIIANQDKKAIQRAYEASNQVLQEERKAYHESSRSKKSVLPS